MPSVPPQGQHDTRANQYYGDVETKDKKKDEKKKSSGYGGAIGGAAAGLAVGAIGGALIADALGKCLTFQLLTLALADFLGICRRLGRREEACRPCSRCTQLRSGPHQLRSCSRPVVRRLRCPIPRLLRLQRSCPGRPAFWLWRICLRARSVR
ncbi:unnamed protein product [Aureobasidium uvarum]|uniref:Uncharacterized protein n=1 Tax=Aureobasidium uvarum TaxID=2773716 RepID=A0A9N8KKB5_9PEZI|nr:unnamed protein product [Aureobasidium uvarum]